MKRTAVLLAMAACLSVAASSEAGITQDRDKVTTYGTIMGRAVACGEDISYSSKRVGAWMDRAFNGKEKSTQLVVFTTTIQYAASEQSAGRSPDSCTSAVRAYKKVNWP